MKTSNILMGIIFLLLISTAVAYAFALKAALNRKEYKLFNNHPLPDASLLRTFPFRDFKMVNIEGDNRLRVDINRSDSFYVAGIKETSLLNFSQSGDTLFVKVIQEDEANDQRGHLLFVKIGCPDLSGLFVDGTLVVEKKELANGGHQTTSYYSQNEVTVKHFSQDSMNVMLNGGAGLRLDSNDIRTFNCTAAASNGLEFSNENRIGKANLNMDAYTEVQWNNARVALIEGWIQSFKLPHGNYRIERKDE